MKLFLISHNQDVNYGSYRSAVVVAQDEMQARNMHPSDGSYINWNDYVDTNDWCNSPEFVIVQYIGEAAKELQKGVICSDFLNG